MRQLLSTSILIPILFSLAFTEQYICNSINLDNPNGVETTTYTRSLFKNSTLEYFKSETNTHNHNFKNLILNETDTHITMVYLVEGDIANLLVTFIDKEKNILYERFNSISPDFDSNQTIAECEVTNTKFDWMNWKSHVETSIELAVLRKSF